MSDDKKHGKIDYSKVTPATGTKPDNIPVADTLANNMPHSDSPTVEGSARSDPDKVIPGSEAASGVDEAEEGKTCNEVEG